MNTSVFSSLLKIYSSLFIQFVKIWFLHLPKSYNITNKTDSGTENYESDNIGEKLLSLLMQYKEKGETIADIQIDRGSLEQHFMKIAKEV